MNIAETIGGARCAFEVAGRGCLVRFGEDEPRYATVHARSYGFQLPRRTAVLNRSAPPFSLA